MFNTEKLIHEVKIRDNLWNCNSERYLDRVARRQAWEEIAQVFYSNWVDFSSAEQGERVEKLMRKWRNVRDYYIKEKKICAKSKLLGVKKKKKYNYYDSLLFLDEVPKQKKRVKDNSSGDEMIEEYLEDTHTDGIIAYDQYSQEDDSNQSSSTATSRNFKQEKEETITSKAILPFETHIMARADRAQDDENVKASKNFLLSLLPDVTSLDGRQNMRFRLGVLNLLNDIKFEQNDNELIMRGQNSFND